MLDNLDLLRWFGVVKSTIPLLVATLVSLALPAAAGDWPCYGADPERSYATGAELTFPLNRSWTYRTSSSPRPAWPEPGKELHRLDFDFCFEPVIAGGLVLFGSSADDSLRALDLKTGELRWRFTTGGPIRFAPAVANGLADAGLDPGSLRVNLFSKTDSGAYGVRSTIPMGEFGHMRCQEFVPLGLGKPRENPERAFQIRLHFAEPDKVEPGARVFDVRIQGETVLSDVDVVGEATAPNAALVKAVSGIRTAGELVIEFVPKSTSPTPSTLPIISALEMFEARE